MNNPSLSPPAWANRTPAAAREPLVKAPGWDLASFYYCSIGFMLGVLRPITISLVGQMPVGELLILAFLGQTALWIILTSHLPSLPAPWLLALFGVTQIISLASYVFTDLYRDSLPIDMIRGWLRMFFLAVDCLGFAILLGREPKAFAWHQFGFSFSFLQALVIEPIFGDYWKFGFGLPVTVIVVMAAPYYAGIGGAIIALLALAGVHAAFAFRSLSAACVAIAALLAVRYLPFRVRQVLVFIGALAFVVSTPKLVSDTFNSDKAHTNRSNVERGAMLRAAWEGFAKSPLIGQGSWFSKSDVMANFLLIRKDVAEETHNSFQFDHTDYEGVAIHSQILVTLAEGGIFGATFFVVYGFATLWGIWYILVESTWSWLLPSRLLLFVGAVWDLLMSPFSGPVRLNIALVSVLIAVFVCERRQARHASNSNATFP